MSLVRVDASQIEQILHHIRSASDLEALTDARARIDAARAWARVHKRVKEVRLQLLRLEVQALVRIVELGGIDALPAGDRKAAQYLTDLSDAQRAHLIAESGNATTATGMVRSIWRTEELERESERLRSYGRNLAADPHFIHLDEATRRDRAAEQVYRVEEVLRDVLDARTGEGEPFTVAQVAEEIIHRATRGEIDDPEIEEGVREVVRSAIRRGPVVFFEGLTLPRLITATTADGVYVRIPVENARLSDLAQMVDQRRDQLAQDEARLRSLSAALERLRALSHSDSERIGDLLLADLSGAA